MTDDKSLQRRIKQHIIAKKHVFFAVIQPNFEPTAKRELEEIGIKDFLSTEKGGIEFTGRLDDCYSVNLCSRTITRLMMRIATFKAIHFSRMKKKIGEIPWELYISNNTELDFNITCHHSRLRHTTAIEEEFRKSIINRLNHYDISIANHTNIGDKKNLQILFIRIDNDICRISLDTSGDPLYKRGYKKFVSDAPLRETIVSLILREADVMNYDTVIDPMSGSGTFSIEAALIFKNVAPGLNRSFAFEKWPSFRQAAFNHLRKKIISDIQSPDSTINKKIFCSDSDGKTLIAARTNIDAAGMCDIIRIEKKNFFTFEITSNQEKTLLVLNPPYGKRLMDDKNISGMYKKIGEKIKSDFSKCGFAIIVPGIKYEKILGLRYDKKIPFINGGLRVAVLIKNG